MTQPRRFTLRLADGRTWPGVEFPSGHIVPNWQDWDAYHGEPRPKPCPDCAPTEEST